MFNRLFLVALVGCATDGDQTDNSLAGAGAVYIFNLSTSVQDAYVKASNPGSDDRFGHSVALTTESPVELIAGAPHESSSATRFDEDQENNDLPQCGAAYRFRSGVSGWQQVYYLKPFNPVAGSLFGTSVTAEPDRAIVGAPGFVNEDGAQTGVFYTLEFE